MEFSKLLNAIESYDSICIFRHGHPDCDAMGSQAGLKRWITDNYASKKVYALGREFCTQGTWNPMDEADDETVKHSLNIILDTANLERVDDERCSTGAMVIKIDHHPNREPFGTLQLVSEKAAATCEILADFFQSAGKTVSINAANDLYCGLLTDTLCFRTSNTTSHTLAMASYIAAFGVDIPVLNRALFDQSLEDFQFAGYIRSHYDLMGSHLAYEVISIKDQEQYHHSASEARNFIDELGHVKEFEVWAIFTEKTEDGRQLYDGSLRSKTVQVNDLAERYHGGGHRNAAGVKNLDEKSLKELLQSLFSRVS